MKILKTVLALILVVSSVAPTFAAGKKHHVNKTQKSASAKKHGQSKKHKRNKAKAIAQKVRGKLRNSKNEKIQANIRRNKAKASAHRIAKHATKRKESSCANGFCSRN